MWNGRWIKANLIDVCISVLQLRANCIRVQSHASELKIKIRQFNQVL